MVNKVIFTSVIVILFIAVVSCEDDAILEPSSSNEDYYGSSYSNLYLPNSSTKYNPSTF